MKIKYETERLIVKEWEEKDDKDLFEMVSDLEVTKFLHYQPYQTLKEAKIRIKNIINSYPLNPFINNFAIMSKKDHKVIGDINISTYKPQAGGSVHIGYTLNRNYQGKGYATEAVIGVLQFIKKNKIAKRIEATHDITNIKSGNVLKRAGMIFEGIARKAGENNFHTRYDVVHYAILEEEIQTDDDAQK